MLREPFGRTTDGEPVERITLRNAAGMTLRAMTWGATITALEAPDRHGQLGDTVLGFDTLDPYLTADPYLGAVVGRVANRIAHGIFTVDGRPYAVARNAGAHHLHGGVRGFDKRLWTARTGTAPGEERVTFSRRSPDGEEGYPGALDVSVTYTLTEGRAVRIEYEATTDAPTPINLTQHAYFNLACRGDVLAHELTLAADAFVATDDESIPTGEIAPVRGTPFDFTAPATVGARIDADHEQLRAGRGYDHTFVLRPRGADPTFAARLRDPLSGRTLEVHTTEPGIQLYTGNYLTGSLVGKRGEVYARRTGLCLETQHFPDAVNRPSFPGTILRPGQTFRSRTDWILDTDSAR